MSDPLNKGEWPEGTDWSFHVHDDGLYASINDGVRGDTLLRIGGQPGPPGSIDQAKVEAFADDYRRRIPLSSIRERLEADGAEAMARKEYELHQEEMGYETVWEEETQGHRNIWLDAARARLDLALDAALPLICHRCNKRAAMDAFKVCWECMGSSGSAALPPSKNEDEKT